MSRVEQAFAKGKALIPFITAGDPDLKTTEQLILEMARAGADLIELGIPFSDPIAEGPVIQRASMRALQAGTTTDKILALVSRVREKSDVPLAFVTYINPIFAFGIERFMHNSREAGIDALIIPDLPFEEKGEILPYCREYGIDLISMIAPTVKAVKDIPCAVGFGIASPEQAWQISQTADGVIVGSAIMQIVEQYGAGCIPQVSAYIRQMKQAINQHEARSAQY
jgi:tryptophan synthase alpha chain